jgi:rare lipoprotein A
MLWLQNAVKWSARLVRHPSWRRAYAWLRACFTDLSLWLRTQPLGRLLWPRGRGSLLWGTVALLGTLVYAGACCPGTVRQRSTVQTASVAPQSTSAPQPKPKGKVLRGQASYYHNSLKGRPTASGEPYDPRKLTAANRTLPLGTKLRVTRLDNGKSVVVRVNDRGPFGHRRRILDLSRAAAEQLDMIRVGVAQVEAEVIE